MEFILNKKIIAVAALAVLMLTGCGHEDTDSFGESRLNVAKKGKVTEQIVESFDKDYYSLDELTGEFESRISGYNDSIGSEEIKLKKINLENDVLTVELEFSGPSDYSNFTGEELFVGSVGDAYDNGYTMDVTLKGVDEGDKIGKVQIMGLIDRNIIILSEHVRVRAFSDIAYVSANVDVLGSNEARVLSESDGLAYIILK